MKKVLVTFIVVAVLLLSAVPVMAASGDPLLKVDYPETMPKAGEEFEVTVSVENNPKIYGVEFLLVFDKEAMTCTDMYGGELVAGAMSVTNPEADGGAKFAAVTLSGFSGDKVAAYCVFKAKKDIEEFDFSLEDAYMLNFDGDNIAYGVQIGDEEVEEIPKEEPPKPVTPDKPDKSDDPYIPAGPSGSGSSDDEPDTSDEQDDKVTEDTKEDTMVKEEASIFADVENHWAKTYVNKAAELGLFKGDTLGNFNPDLPVTRAQFVTVLWRLAGRPEVADETSFVDTQNQIPEFKSAIAWGYKNGCINGTSATTFAPDGTLTREAGMKILHYYSGGASGNEVLFTSVYDGIFTDSNTVSTWAKPSVYWGIYNKLISGTSADTLTPQGTATRAQLAKILVSYIESFNVN